MLLRKNVRFQVLALLSMVAVRAVVGIDFVFTNLKGADTVFASTSQMEALALIEGKIIKRLENLYNKHTSSMKILKSYLDEWRDTDMESFIEEDSESHFRQLSRQRQLLKHEIRRKERDGHFERVALSVRLAAEHRRNQTVRRDPVVTAMKKSMGAGPRHPIDAYLIVKRIALNLVEIDQELGTFAGKIEKVLDKVEHDRSKMEVTGDDLKTAASALVRLQDMYHLNIRELIRGRLSHTALHGDEDIQGLGQLGLWDMMYLGKAALDHQFKEQSREWFAEAGRKVQVGEQVPSDMQYLRHHLNNTVTTQKILSNAPPQENKSNSHVKQIPGGMSEAERTKLLCSGKKLMSAEQEAALHCRLDTRQSAYLLLMPLKLEELHHSPRVVLFRDFLTKPQTDYFIANAINDLEPSTTANDGRGSKKRISKTGWLGKEEYNAGDEPDPEPEQDLTPQLTYVNKRIAATTGLTVCHIKASESYQVANYGIGGMFSPHLDAYDDDMENGDRLISFLIYLSEVNGGGATVFPTLGVRVVPERGSAILWYNLHRHGPANHLMRHSACPVLHGNKWIVTKWALYDEQVFKFPCALHLNDQMV